MNIGIDARLYGQGLGLGRYVSKLIEHLEKREDEHSYIIFLRKDNFDLYEPHNPRFTKALADVPWYSLSEQLILPLIFFRARCDILHVPHFNIPLLYPKKIIVTIHDVILLKHPRSATSAASTRPPFIHWLKYQAYRIILWFSCMRACRIIAVSQSTAADIKRFFPFVEQKTIVIYEAADKLPTLTADSIVPVSVPQPFFLYAGNAYPHKNLSVLLSAMKMLNRTNTDVKLVMCGQEDYFQKKLCREIASRGIGEYVRHLGTVSDGELCWLYEHAVAVVLPSREEGFGLQILEAFLHGCPVIASRIPAYEEIAGDAAVFVDSTKPEHIVSALIMLLSDNALRLSMIENGHIRANEFSWDATAERTCIAYHQCLR